MGTMTYSYEDLPLTKSIVRELILQLTKHGEIASRANLIQKVVRHHEINGGILPKDGNAVNQTKAALRDMKAFGEAEPTAAVGYWKIIHASPVPETIDPTPINQKEYVLQELRRLVAYLEQ